MNNKITIPYYDRANDALMQEQVYAGGFLFWSYNTKLGRLATDLLFRQRLISRAYGWLSQQRFSRREILPFVKKTNICIDELTYPLKSFDCFNDFFTREIDLTKRSICSEPDVCIAPVDGKILAYPVVRPDSTFRIKRSLFNLQDLLGDWRLGDEFAGGSMIVSRLCLTDYHHFHFPDSGIPNKAASIPGKYYAGGPYALRSFIPFYKENHRMVTLLDSDHFKRMALVEIGAFTVGSIQQRYQPGHHVSKGAHKGFFELGGSTVVLLFQRGTIELDQDLCANTKNEIETHVRLGDSVGRRPKASTGKLRRTLE